MYGIEVIKKHKYGMKEHFVLDLLSIYYLKHKKSFEGEVDRFNEFCTRFLMETVDNKSAYTDFSIIIGQEFHHCTTLNTDGRSLRDIFEMSISTKARYCPLRKRKRSHNIKLAYT